MSALTLLAQLRQAGVVLRCAPGVLRYKAPKGVMTPALLLQLTRHKDALLDLLEAFEERAAIAEYCGGLSREDAERWAWACVLGKEEMWTSTT